MLEWQSGVIFFNTPEETHKSICFPYKQVSGINGYHEWLRMTNAFILCDLLWTGQKSHAANREGSFKVVNFMYSRSKDTVLTISDNYCHHTINIISQILFYVLPALNWHLTSSMIMPPCLGQCKKWSTTADLQTITITFLPELSQITLGWFGLSFQQLSAVGCLSSRIKTDLVSYSINDMLLIEFGHWLGH